MALNPYVAIFSMGTILHLISICVRVFTNSCPYSNMKKTARDNDKRVDMNKKNIVVLKKAQDNFSDKIHSEKKETSVSAAAAKEEMPSPAKRKWMEIGRIYDSLENGTPKVSGTIVKSFKSDKAKLRKSVNCVIDASKQPVKSISDIDRKVVRSMKKVFPLRASGIS